MEKKKEKNQNQIKISNWFVELHKQQIFFSVNSSNSVSDDPIKFLVFVCLWLNGVNTQLAEKVNFEYNWFGRELLIQLTVLSEVSRPYENCLKKSMSLSTSVAF